MELSRYILPLCCQWCLWRVLPRIPVPDPLSDIIVTKRHDRGLASGLTKLDTIIPMCPRLRTDSCGPQVSNTLQLCCVTLPALRTAIKQLCIEYYTQQQGDCALVMLVGSGCIAVRVDELFCRLQVWTASA